MNETVVETIRHERCMPLVCKSECVGQLLTLGSLMCVCVFELCYVTYQGIQQVVLKWCSE